ncbi:hypothetical protein ACIGJK_13980 [Pseudomonas iridis]|uniref:hypothetical protein n=1 Tax=Pseudomonas iridis TaxID=2710587 RepID=UPI0037CAB179
MESPQYRTEGVFWWTVSKLAVAVPIAALFGAGVSALFMGGMDYGQLKSSLDAEKNTSLNLRKNNDELSSLLEKWREAVAQRDTVISSLQSKLSAMQNDQCEAIRQSGNGIQYSIENAELYQYGEEKRAHLLQMYEHQQKTLQACLAARR